MGKGLSSTYVVLDRSKDIVYMRGPEGLCSGPVRVTSDCSRLEARMWASKHTRNLHIVCLEVVRGGV